MKLFIIILSFALTLSSNFYSQPDSVQTEFIYTSQKAKSVSVAGSFNGWDPANYEFNKIDDSTWNIYLKLPAGYYYYKLVVDGKWIPDPENPNKINDGGTSFNSIIKVGTPPIPKRTKSNASFPKDKLPRPVLTENADFIDLYYAAWEMAWQKISHGTSQNGFVENYMDEGFSEQIYQWDTCFMLAFGMYSNDIFPAMPSLDNFYKKQRINGYIQRVYNEKDGSEVHEPSKDEPMVNPPLFVWIELKYFNLTGDDSRLKRVLPVLVKYFNWIENNCRTDFGKGLYYTSELGSGMDNTPRINAAQSAWIDFSSQQALAAKSISEIAEIIGDKKISIEFKNHFIRIKNRINELLWSDEKGFYFDLSRNDTLTNTKHIGTFWTMLSNISDSNSNGAMIKHLQNPNEFWRMHLVPTLSADDPQYDPKGNYWHGSVWAPTNYMVVKGLEKQGYQNLADKIALNHIQNMDWIYKNFTPDEKNIAYEERYADGYKTIWECYSPDFKEPATRWDKTFYSRQDFVGWSGLGPISMLIENILGFEIKGAENKITWRLHRKDKHGIENINLKDQKVSLIATPNDKGNFVIKIYFERPFDLEIVKDSENNIYKLKKENSKRNSKGKFETVISL